MKTLTAKLAVAALLVAGVAQANVYVNNGLATVGVFTEGQKVVTAWNAAQKNATKAQRAKNVTNYVLPVAKSAAFVALAARANGVDCARCPDFLTANRAAGALATAVLFNYLWDNRTDAQVAADAAVVAAVQAQAQSSDKAAKRS